MDYNLIFLGVPAGFRCKPAHINDNFTNSELLVLPSEKIRVFADKPLYCIRRKTIYGKVYTCFAIYNKAEEAEIVRAGSYYGAAIVSNNSEKTFNWQLCQKWLSTLSEYIKNKTIINDKFISTDCIEKLSFKDVAEKLSQDGNQNEMYNSQTSVIGSLSINSSILLNYDTIDNSFFKELPTFFEQGYSEIYFTTDKQIVKFLQSTKSDIKIHDQTENSKLKQINAKLEQTNLAQQQDLEKQKTAYQQELEKQKTAYQQDSEKQKSAHQQELEKQKSAHQQELEKQKSAHQQELEKQKSAHQQDLEKQKSAHQQQVKTLEQQLNNQPKHQNNSSINKKENTLAKISEVSPTGGNIIPQIPKNNDSNKNDSNKIFILLITILSSIIVVLVFILIKYFISPNNIINNSDKESSLIPNKNQQQINTPPPSYTNNSDTTSPLQNSNTNNNTSENNSTNKNEKNNTRVLKSEKKPPENTSNNNIVVKSAGNPAENEKTNKEKNITKPNPIDEKPTNNDTPNEAPPPTPEPPQK
jgi:hypothetical protein